MFETLKRLYQEKRIDASGLERAVLRGWITEEQRQEITGRE